MINLPPDVIYNPDFFNTVDIDDAKRIVLGHGISETESKWQVETDWNLRLFDQKKFLNENSIVLDWGVGIGRLSKAIIEKYNCQVVGVDINENMISYSRNHVNSDRFTSMTVKEFTETNTTKFTNAIAVWALQHSIDVVSDLLVIKQSLLPSGKLFVFEERRPCIPTTGNNPWFILNKSNFTTIDKTFTIIEHGIFPPHFNILENNNAWWGFFNNK